MVPGIERSRVPGLLPWQICLLAYALGALAVESWVAPVVALCLLLTVDAILRRRRIHPAVPALCAAAGFLYAGAVLPQSPPVPPWVQPGEKVVVHGTVESVRTKPDMRLQMVLSDLSVENDDFHRSLQGKMVWTWKYPRRIPEPEQAVSVPVNLRPLAGFANPGLWNYEAYWQREGVFWRGWSIGKADIRWGPPPDGTLWSLRTALHDSVVSALPKGQGGAVVLNLLTGDRTHIMPETLDAVRSAGLAHILALSGLHVGYVALFGLLLAHFAGFVRPGFYLSMPRPKMAVLLAMPLVALYWWLGQPSASLTRASLMFFCWGFLLLAGRGRALVDGLFAALAIIILLDPLAVFDTGLRMSACAVAGIAFLFPVLRRWIAVRGRGFLRRSLDAAAALLCIGIAANIALLPVVAHGFGTVAPDLLLNLVWVPVVGFVVMPLGIAGMLAGALSNLYAPFAEFGNVLVLAASHVMDVLLDVLHWYRDAGLAPMGAVLRPLWPEMLGFAVLLAAALAQRRQLAVAALGTLLLFIPHIQMMVQDMHSVRLDMIDVGQGQAVLISTPGGHRVLVDGGGVGGRTFDIGRAIVGPYVAHGRPPRLDAVVMSHADHDHMGGLAWIVERFEVGRFIGNGETPDGISGGRIVAALKERGIPEQRLTYGDVFNAGEVAFRMVGPAADTEGWNSNERSLVLRVEWLNQPLALLPGDAERRSLQSLAESPVPCDAEVLVVPHHGSAGSVHPEALDAVNPELALVSCGKYNRYGFPKPEVLEEFERIGARVVRTDVHGAVRVRWLEPYSPQETDTARRGTFPKSGSVVTEP